MFIFDSDPLRTAIAEGRLRPLRTIEAGDPAKRAVLVTPNLERWFRAAKRRADVKRVANLRVAIDAFVRGDRVAPDFIRRLEPLELEVWNMRFPGPKPGLRIFGRFAARDVFIGTQVEERRELGSIGSDAYEAAITRCLRLWRKAKIGEPFRAETEEDYYSI